MRNTNILKDSRKNKGFTIIETLVAITILMISIAGPLVIAQKGLMAAIYAKDQVTASFLAQDAMEYIKNQRDSNVISDGISNWLLSLSSCINNNCTIDTVSGSFTLIILPNNVTATNLYISNNGGYTHQSSSGTLSQFSRYFTITLSDSGDEATVKVTVERNNGNITNALNLESEIFKIERY